MTQAAKLPSTATRRTGGSQPPLNGDGLRGVVGWRGEIRDNEVVKTHEEGLEEEQREQDLRGEQDLVGDRDRDDGNDRDDRTDRDERDSHDEYSDQRRRTERGEQDLSRNQGGVQRAVEQVTDRVRAATSNPVDAFATTPDMSKVLTAWFDVAGDMMKLQQRFFASMLGAGNTNDRTTTKV